MKKFSLLLNWNSLLWVLLCVALFLNYLKIFQTDITNNILVGFIYISVLPVVYSAIKSLKNKKVTVDLLASVALVVAILNKEWVSVIFINLMITSARIFADYISGRSKQEVESLMKLRPEKAKVERNGKVVDVPVNELAEGDLILVELGEMIPVDGKIIKGEAAVDQSSLTGESMPIAKKVGDEVLSASVVANGFLTISAEKVGKNTTLEKMINLVEKAQSSKGRITTISDRFSGYYILVMFLLAIAIYAFSRDLKLVLSILLVSCADDLAVAIPMAFSAAIVASAKRGAIVKGGDFIDAISKVKTVVFDKTGTLTKGKLKVVEVFPLDDIKLDSLLHCAGMASFLSHHPAAQAVNAYIEQKGVKVAEPDKFSEQSGKGVEVICKNEIVFTGKESFLREKGVKITDEQLALINKEKEKGYSVMLIAYNKELAGFITMADEIRHETKKSISALRKEGVNKIVMLTGDNEKIASRVAGEVEITDFHANLLPEDKINYLKKYINKKDKTAMIGDGVNDAAALSLADVGIAMGAIGSDVAIESADIALMKDNLEAIPQVIGIGRDTLDVVYQNIWIWLITNAIGLILVFMHVLDPSGAALYNFITDFLPIINSFRLFSDKGTNIRREVEVEPEVSKV